MVNLRKILLWLTWKKRGNCKSKQNGLAGRKAFKILAWEKSRVLETGLINSNRRRTRSVLRWLSVLKLTCWDSRSPSASGIGAGNKSIVKETVCSVSGVRANDEKHFFHQFSKNKKFREKLSSTFVSRNGVRDPAGNRRGDVNYERRTKAADRSSRPKKRNTIDRTAPHHTTLPPHRSALFHYTWSQLHFTPPQYIQ